MNNTLLSNQEVTLVAFLCLIAIIQLIFFIRSYKKPTPVKALIVHGKVDPQNKVLFKTYRRKPAFVWPIIQDFYFLDLDDYELSQKLDTIDANGNSITIEINCLARPNQNNLDQVIEQFFEKPKTQIEGYLRKTIEMEIRNIISNNKAELQSRDNLTSEIKNKINSTIESNNFILYGNCYVRISH